MYMLWVAIRTVLGWIGFIFIATMLLTGKAEPAEVPASDLPDIEVMAADLESKHIQTFDKEPYLYDKDDISHILLKAKSISYYTLNSSTALIPVRDGEWWNYEVHQQCIELELPGFNRRWLVPKPIRPSVYITHVVHIAVEGKMIVQEWTLLPTTYMDLGNIVAFVDFREFIVQWGKLKDQRQVVIDVGDSRAEAFDQPYRLVQERFMGEIESYFALQTVKDA